MISGLRTLLNPRSSCRPEQYTCADDVVKPKMNDSSSFRG
jgi:hypothetical protein